jgi:hypothetical protein
MRKWTSRILLLGTVVLGMTVAAVAESGGVKYLLSVLTGSARRAYFGSAVVGGVDWVGAGKKFIAVGATGAIGGPVQRGTVYFYDELAGGEPRLTLTGPEDGDLFGRRLSGKSDMNGDGIPDLAVAAPYGRTGSQKPGKVYLYLGGDNFTGLKPAVFSANETGDAFGMSVCLERDLNGDGLADLVVGAPYSNRGGPLAGRAYLWWGASNLKGGTEPDVILRHGTTNDMFGTALAVGDLNGDGQADLAIGSPQHNVGDKIPGSVFVYYGGRDAKWDRPSKILSGETTTFHDHFGASVAIVGDVNGDGVSDLLIGAPNVSVGGSARGKAYLFWGGQDFDANPDQQFDGEADLGRLGSMVFAMGDLNGDGKADFAIQAEEAEGAQGVLYFYYGGWERAFYELSGEGTGDRLGDAAVTLGDMDGDGTQDVVVGARWNDAGGEDAGRVYILSFPR